MELEQYIAHLNSLVFWREFTFAENDFSPEPGRALELADNLVWLGERAYVLQLKQRERSSGDPTMEARWFQKKVVGKATKQIRDSLSYLNENPSINVKNLHGHDFTIETRAIRTVINLVIFLAAQELPEECRKKRFHISETTGYFVHLIAAHDYLGILEKLRVPEEVARYFEYREKVVTDLDGQIDVDESDTMGAFLTEQPVPKSGSRLALAHLWQDTDNYDLSGLLADLHKHIENSDSPYDYYEILREFSKCPRSVWRAVKERFLKALEVSGEGKFALPYRVTFPDTDCSFMVAALDPKLPCTGEEGERVRRNGLANLTAGLKYLMKSKRCVGILISRDGEFVQIDWCFTDYSWQFEPEMEKWLAESNPFRSASEKQIDGYKFIDLPPPHSPR